MRQSAKRYQTGQRRRGAGNMLRRLAVVVALLAGVWPALPAVATTWELLTPFAPDDFETRNLEQFAAEVGAASEGRLTLVVLPAPPQLQGEGLMRAVAAGRVPAGEFMLADAGDAAVFQVDRLPFLARDFDQARALWEASRPVLQPSLEASGLQVAIVVPRPPRGLFVSRELWTIEDFRGVRLLNDGPLAAALAPLLGMQPVPLPASASASASTSALAAGPLASGFKSNRIDAAVADAPAGVAEKIWTVVGNFYDLRIALPKSALVFNRAAVLALDEESQRALLNAAVNAQNRGWQGSAAAHNAALDELQANGMTVAVLPPETAPRLAPLGDAPARDWARRAGPDGERILATYRASQPPR